MTKNKWIDEDRLVQDLQGGFVPRNMLLLEKKKPPLLNKGFLAKIFWFTLGLALGILWGGEAFAWDSCAFRYRAWVRSPAYHQTFHQRAHCRAMRIHYCKERRKNYARSTRSVHYQKPYRTSRSRRAYVYPCKPICRFSCRNRVYAYPLLHQKFRCRRSSYSRTVGPRRGYRPRP